MVADVRPLFPDAPNAADQDSTAEVMASCLEEFAAMIRSGELSIRYGIFAVMKTDSRVATYAVGESTFHKAILLTDLAHALEMNRLLGDG